MSAVEGWISCPLGNLIVPKNDKAKQVKSTEYATVGSYPIVDQSSDFICGYHDDPTKVINDNLPLTVFGDHTRHTKYISFPFIAGADGTQLLKAKEEIEDKFFYYIVSRAAEKIGNFGYDRHFKHLKEYVCDFPTSKPEQTKIAEILSTVDRAIEQTEELIAKQQRIKTGLMQDLLTRGIDEHGNLRSEQTHEFKDSPLGRIPVEWEAISFGEIIQKNGGMLQTGPFGSQLHSYEYVAEGTPVVMPQDINTNGISIANIARITEKKSASLSRHRMIPGNLVFARRGDLSRCAVIRENQKGWLCGTGCLLMRLPSKKLSPRWTAETYRFYTSQLQIDVSAVGSTMPNLNTGILMGLIVSLPSIEEQIRIEEQLLTAVNDEEAVRNQLAKLRSLKTAMMQDLLTGKNRVTVLLKGTEFASI